MQRKTNMSLVVRTVVVVWKFSVLLPTLQRQRQCDLTIEANSALNQGAIKGRKMRRWGGSLVRRFYS